MVMYSSTDRSHCKWLGLLLVCVPLVGCPGEGSDQSDPETFVADAGDTGAGADDDASRTDVADTSTDTDAGPGEPVSDTCTLRTSSFAGRGRVPSYWSIRFEFRDRRGRVRRYEGFSLNKSHFVEVKRYDGERLVDHWETPLLTSYGSYDEAIHQQVSYANGRRSRSTWNGPLLGTDASTSEPERIVEWEWMDGRKRRRTVDGVPLDSSVFFEFLFQSPNVESPDGTPETVQSWSYEGQSRERRFAFGEAFDNRTLEIERTVYDDQDRPAEQKYAAAWRRLQDYGRKFEIETSDLPTRGEWSRIVDWTYDSEGKKQKAEIDYRLFAWQESRTEVRNLFSVAPDGTTDVVRRWSYGPDGHVQTIRRDGNLDGLLAEGARPDDPDSLEPATTPDGVWDSQVRYERREISCPDTWAGAEGGSNPLRACSRAVDWCEATADCETSMGSLSEVATGAGHSCALTESGEVYCWGRNDFGQLGVSSGMVRRHPVAVETDRQFADLTAGAQHTCGRTAAGEIYCWGRNREGQLGDDSLEPTATPTRIAADGPFFEVEAAGLRTCALAGSPGADEPGRVWCWGSNDYLQTSQERTRIQKQPSTHGTGTYRSLHLTARRSCAASDTLECWGAHIETSGTSPLSHFAPFRAERDIADVGASPRALSWFDDATAIAVARHRECKAVGPADEILCRAAGTDNVASVPLQGEIRGLELISGDVCALKASGELYCTNSEALDFEKFRQADGEDWTFQFDKRVGQSFTRLETGAHHSCAIDSGTLRCRGLNFLGVMGTGKRGEFRSFERVSCQK